MLTEIPTYIKDVFARDARIKTVIEYTSGWVPNAYKWRAPGKAIRYSLKDGIITAEQLVYDRKRSRAKGPVLVGFSEKNGRLFSY